MSVDSPSPIPVSVRHRGFDTGSKYQIGRNGTCTVQYATPACLGDLGTAFCTRSTLTERAPSSEEPGAREVPCLRRQRHFGRRRGVVTHFQLYQVVNGTVVSRPMKSSCRRRLVRRSTGDPPGRLWIFSLSTRRGATYFYRVTLNDASAFTFNFTVKTRATAPSSRRRNGRELADFRAAQTRRWRPVRSPQA